MFLLSSTRRSLLLSLNGIPISSMAPLNAFTSHANAICTCFFCSWCRQSLSCLFLVENSNSSITRAISGPDTIQRCRAAGFSVKPTAPPSPFTDALFCSCAWSMTFLQKMHVVFFALHELLIHIVMTLLQQNHVTQVNWYPSRVMDVVQGTILVRATMYRAGSFLLVLILQRA